MGKNSKIAWCDHTFNPWTGCSPVSEACENCYAAAWAKKTGRDFSKRKLTSDENWKQPAKWNRAAAEEGTPARVFCGSLCDIGDEAVDPNWRHRAFLLAEETPFLTWMYLTKRPRVFEWGYTWGRNEWLGVTAETTARFHERWDELKRQVAPVRFVSAEPMLDAPCAEMVYVPDWLILGCESRGNGLGRETRLEWVRTVCENRRGPTFVKQLGINGRLTRDPADWPEWARRQEFPA